MADEKVTDLTTISTVSTDDLLYIVDDPGGSPLSRAITAQNLVSTTPHTEVVGSGGMQVSGGSSDGESLTLVGNTTDFKDPILMDSPVEFFESGASWTAAGNNVGVMGRSDGTLTVDYSSWSFGAIAMAGTIEIGQAPALFGGIALFAYSAIVQQDSGALSNTGQVNQTFVDFPTYNANGANFTVGSHVGFFSSVGVTEDSGTMTLSTLEQFKAQVPASANNGTTGTRRAFIARDMTDGAGTWTVTNQVGLAVEELDHATNNTAVLLGTTTTPTGNWAIYSDTTAASHFDGPIQFDEMATPANPAAEDVVMYKKGDEFIWAFNDGGTMSYIGLDLTDGTITDHGASAP